jgi:O-antigen/teichoic acid export membrane protein
MIVTSIFFGLAAAITVIILYHRLPNLVRRFLNRHPLFTETITSIGLYLTFSKVSSSMISIGSTIVAGLAWTTYFLSVRSQNNGNRRV